MRPLLLFLVLGCWLTGSVDAREPETKKESQVYKNLQVLGDLSAKDLPPAMDFISGALGVRCSHCHVNPFAADKRPAKQTARKMIRMVWEINKTNFNDKMVVNCSTCHQGQTHPAGTPPLGDNFFGKASQEAPRKAVLPTVDQLLAKYVEAVGGEQALTKPTTRIAKGSRIGADDVVTPETVYQKAPNKILTVTSYRMEQRTAYNGTAAWRRNGTQPSQPFDSKELLAQLQRDAQFCKEMRLKELYKTMTVAGTASLGQREAYLVEGTLADGRTEKLYFDSQSGLLVRQIEPFATVLGSYPIQTDYEDYREVGGIRLPFTIRWSMPGRTWGRKINEIQHDVPIDDAQFDPPSSK